MAPTHRNSDTFETPAIGPDWNGDAKTRQPWWAKLGRRLVKEDKRFESHLKYGCHIDKASGKTITRSTAHSRQLYNCAIKAGTYDDPFDTACVILVAGAPDDEIPDDIKPQYISNPGRCDQVDSDILAFIVSTILSDTKGEDISAKAGGSGTRALQQLAAHRPIAEIRLWADGRLAEVRAAGFGSADTPSLNQYRDDFRLYNVQASVPCSVPVICTDLLDQARKLGVHISGLLDYQLLADKTDITVVESVVGSIETVFTRHNARDASTPGKSLQASSDPAKDRRGDAPPAYVNGVRVYRKGFDETCTNCTAAPKDVGGGPGHHLRSKCPDRPALPPAAAGGTPKNKKGGARMLGPGEACDEADEYDEDDSTLVDDGSIALADAFRGGGHTISVSESMSRQGAANVAARSPSTPAPAAVALPPAVAPSSAASAPATPLAPLGHREARARRCAHVDVTAMRRCARP